MGMNRMRAGMPGSTLEACVSLGGRSFPYWVIGLMGRCVSKGKLSGRQS